MQTMVKVPATSANCGPGFDTFGISCALYNTLTLSLTDAGEVNMSVTGEGACFLKPGESNLAVKAIRRILAETGRESQGIRLVMDNKIPLSRGLGSSSAAIVGGMTAANALLGSPLSKEKIFELATEMEGHPDNVAPAIYGGITLSFMEGKKPCCVKLAPPPELRMIAVVPDFQISTKVARDALPGCVPREDAVFNLSRAALFAVAICNNELDLLHYSLQDKLHQPYRSKLIPGIDDVFAAAKQAGALGCFISGSGSTLIALARAGSDTGKISAAMREAFVKYDKSAACYLLPFDFDGASITADRLAVEL